MFQTLKKKFSNNKHPAPHVLLHYFFENALLLVGQVHIDLVPRGCEQPIFCLSVHIHIHFIIIIIIFHIQCKIMA